MVPPLLNQYKHDLAWDRLQQSITGGLAFHCWLPWHTNVLQALLWMLPLLVSAPHTLLAELEVLNEYYASLLCGIVFGLCVFLLVLCVACCRRYFSRRCHAASIELERAFNTFEEEDRPFITSCCSLRALNFLCAPRRWCAALVQTLFAGLVAFSATFLLLPRVMQEVMSLGGVVPVFLFGWFAVSSASYSLSARPPVETALYRPTDPLQLRFLSRPLCVVAIAIAFILVREFVADPTVYLQLLYVLLCLLPLGWTIGALPPIDALVSWTTEQLLVHILGGSPMATDLRLWGMFGLSVFSTGLSVLVSRYSLEAAVLMGAALGLLLSGPLLPNLARLARATASACVGVICCCKKKKKKEERTRGRWLCSSSLTRMLDDGFPSLFTSYYFVDFRSVTLSKTFLKSAIVTGFKEILILPVAVILVYFTYTLWPVDGALTALGILTIALYPLQTFVDNLQSVFVFRVFRSPLHPHVNARDNIARFKKWKNNLKWVRIGRQFFVNYVLPLVLLTFVGLSLCPQEKNKNGNFWFAVTSSRILRKVWQNTISAHLELSIAAVIQLALPPEASNATNTTLCSANGTVAGVEFGTQLLIIGFLVSTLESCISKMEFLAIQFYGFVKNRDQVNTCCYLLTIVSFVVFSPLSLGAVVLSSLLSAPLLSLFTLPIPLVSYPRPRSFWPGLWRRPASSKPQDGIYYQQALPEMARAVSSSVSSGAARVSSGSQLLLRFQDRLALATVLEVGHGFHSLDIRGLELQETSCHTTEANRVDDIFDSAYSHGGKKPCPQFWFNGHLFNTLQPVDSDVICVYSDARSQLTGIIDQPANLKQFSSNLLRVLAWVLLHHLCKSKPPATTARASVTNAPGASNIQETNTDKTDKMQVPSSDSEVTQLSAHIAASSQEKEAPLSKVQVCLRSQHNNRNQEIAKEMDALSWSSSIFGSEDLGFAANSSPPLPGFVASEEDKEDENTATPVQSTVRLSSIRVTQGAGAYLPHHQDSACEAKSGSFLPEAWKLFSQSDNKDTHVLHCMKKEERWLEFILRDQNYFLGSEAVQELRELVMACFACIDVPASTSGKDPTKPFALYRGFQGNFQTLTSSWLKDKELFQAVLKAYRYAVRLLYDEAILGRMESFIDLDECLQDYRDRYYIGCETDEEWSSCVLERKPHLFSFGHDTENDCYTAHVLTLQSDIVHIGLLNAEGTHAIWTDLALELFYLTNEDDERYSIQAQPSLLRNILIQSADPPLGYPIFNSGTIQVPS